MGLASDTLNFLVGNPILFTLMVWILVSIVAFRWRHKTVKQALSWFLNYRLWTFTTIFSVLFLVASILIGDTTHFSTVLFIGGIISAILFVTAVYPPKGEVIEEGGKQVVKERARKLKFGWIFAGMIVGVLAVFSAWVLFPKITAEAGWITFFVLMLLGFTFLIRAVPAMHFSVYVPVAIAYYVATNAPTWVHPVSAVGVTIVPGDPLILLITAVLTVLVFLISFIILWYLTHATSFINKVLNAPPLLLITTLICLSWAGLLVIFRWSL